ncbi:phosphoribosylaminoimidazolesuccinocarboxamide synthase [Isosphaeraceae bacterium EP7]
MGEAYTRSDLGRGLPCRRGKVRDVYDLGDRLLIVATDRISAYDWILPTGIPDKGRILTGLSEFWFSKLGVRHHLISTNPVDAGLGLDPTEIEQLRGRSMVVKKAEVVPFECVVRGYLSGSGWREYRQSGTVCGERLAEGLVESSRIDPPIFTPATKADAGHDENVSFETMAQVTGIETADKLRRASLDVYSLAAEHAANVGLILADTKFEWGRDSATRELMLVDEVLTPDSSRYWPADKYAEGGPQPSFDKQYVRDWLDASGWDKSSEAPPLPAEVVELTRAKYVQAYETLTGRAFTWE